MGSTEIILNRLEMMHYILCEPHKFFNRKQGHTLTLFLEVVVVHNAYI